MATRSSVGSRAECFNASGFGLVEAMISVSIVGLLALFVVVDLRSTQKHEQLINAARIVAADLRSLQARALTAQNLKTCADMASKNVVCERSTASCADPTMCTLLPPFAVGGHFIGGATAYTFFADVDPDVARKDFVETADAGESFFTRALNTSGGQNVVIADLRILSGTTAHAHVAFERQNGGMHITPCAASCPGVTMLTIRLRQTQTGETKDVTLNAVTGRISIE